MQSTPPHPQWQSLDFEQLIASGAAFISIDAQNSILSPQGCLAHEGIWRGAREPGGSLDNTLKIARKARELRMLRMWLRYDRFIGEKEPCSALDRVQYAHWNADYRGDAARKKWESDLTPEAQEELRESDLTLVYPGWSIFNATGVDRRLNQAGVQTLLLCGYHTDWCVEMAARHARELGYNPLVVGDACGSTSPLHEEALVRMDASFAPVVTTAQVLAAMAGVAARR